LTPNTLRLLNCIPPETGLVIEIRRFFEDKDEVALKALRQDWANDLADWLKPLPEKKRRPDRGDKYTGEERGRESFYITYTEPDPIWREAYVCALADLGINADGEGHTFHAVLQEVAGNALAGEVRRAGEKAIRELGNLRDGCDYWGA